MSKKTWWVSGDKGVKVKAPSSYVNPMPKCHPNKKFTIHNEGVNRACDNTGQHVKWLAQYAVDQKIHYHFVYCPLCGHWAQCAPVDTAARAMKGGSVNSCGNSANRCGTLNIQVCLAGYGTQKLPPPKKWKNAKKFRKIAEEWGIPAKSRNLSKVNRSKDKWNNKKTGWHGHSNGPLDDHTDPTANGWDVDAFKKDVLKK